MRLTSSEANKLLKKLNADYNAIINHEALTSTYLAASSEDPEALRPDYNYDHTQLDLEGLAYKIRTIKHALNVFNTGTVIPEFDMTIDELLVYLPQLSERVKTLEEMRGRLPRERVRSLGTGSSAIIDYRYTNFDSERVSFDFEMLRDRLARVQTALDIVNNNEFFDVDINI